MSWASSFWSVPHQAGYLSRASACPWVEIFGQCYLWKVSSPQKPRSMESSVSQTSQAHYYLGKRGRHCAEPEGRWFEESCTEEDGRWQILRGYLHCCREVNRNIPCWVIFACIKSWDCSCGNPISSSLNILWIYIDNKEHGHTGKHQMGGHDEFPLTLRAGHWDGLRWNVVSRWHSQGFLSWGWGDVGQRAPYV